MKRDNDFIRNLLFEMEEFDDIVMEIPWDISSNAEEKKRYHHAQLLCNAGFFQEIEPDSGVYRMTSQGYDYLESIRSNNIWEKTKAATAEINGATLGIMGDLARAYLKQELKAKLNIDIT